MEKLLKSVQKGAVEDVRELVATGMDVSRCGKKGLNALHLAAQSNNAEILAALLESPTADVNARDQQQGWPLLLHGISVSSGGAGDLNILRQILKVKGCDVNASDSEGNTCLHWAAMLNEPAVLELLLHSGAYKDAVNNSRETALHVAAKEGHEEATAVLLQQNFDVNAKDSAGRTPLHWAVLQRNANLANALLQDGRLITSSACKDAQGNTPLHLAVQERSEGLASKMIARGFAADERNAAGQTVEDIRMHMKEEAEMQAKRRTAAREEKEERKRRQLEEEFEASEVTTFCRKYGVSDAAAHTFFKRHFKQLDDEFFALDGPTLKKLGLTKADQGNVEAGRIDHKLQIERQEQEARRRLEEAVARKQRTRRLLGGVLVLIVFVTVYMGLEIFISYWTRGTRNRRE